MNKAKIVALVVLMAIAATFGVALLFDGVGGLLYGSNPADTAARLILGAIPTICAVVLFREIRKALKESQPQITDRQWKNLANPQHR